MSIKIYGELFASESLRGERIHWKINWIIYPALLLLSILTWSLQNNRVAGIVGISLSLANILYNTFLGYFIYRKKSVQYLSYITISLNILSVAVYNYFDALSNGPALTATSAAILIYPLIMFLASLRMDGILVAYSTILCTAVMNLLYFHFNGFFSLDRTKSLISADWISQGYRTIYLLALGYMIYAVPKTMRRVLIKQAVLIKEKTIHKKKAEKDPLTSLYNRYYLEAYFEQCKVLQKTKGTRYGLLYIDLNDFKQINDTHGHDFGDFILISVGTSLKSVVRDEDVVARIGGDEIIVLVSLSSGQSGVEELAERVYAAINQPRTLNDKTITVKASIGVSIFPDQADSLDTLLKKADQAMYSIKKLKNHGIAYA